MWIAAILHTLSMLISSTNGLTAHLAGDGNNSNAPDYIDNIFLTNDTINLQAVDGELSGTQIETLCLRMHNNTAFIGTQPYTRLMFNSASECRRYCVDIYPECVAVMFYYLHKRNTKHICYLFNKNSVAENVALVPERPLKKLDMVRALEIVPDCHQFDPFPPLQTEYTTSTDRVSKKKRDVGFQRPVEASGPWTAWSECSVRTKRQVRSQPCEYGRNIQRRHCFRTNLYRSHSKGSPTVDVTVSYPPYPYKHPSVSSGAYTKIMNQHNEQFARACCYWRDYFRNQAAASGKSKINLNFGAECPIPCPKDSLTTKPTPTDKTPAKSETPAVWSSWTTWSQCSATCGAANMQRYRVCETKGCVGENVEWQLCDQNEVCPETWAEWSFWSVCQATCGTGEKTRTRYCHLGQGRCSGVDYEVASCEVGPCPEWMQWESWSHCSVTCGIGIKQRMRLCYGENCHGRHYEESECQEEVCGQWSSWQEWSTCSTSCGEGISVRERVCLGSGCEGESIEKSICMEQTCSEWQEWGEWSGCSTTCDYGISIRERSCYGIFCPGKKLEVMKCRRIPCMDISGWQDWSQWSQCSATCGSGFQIRNRICTANYCPGNAQETQSCEAEVSCAQWMTWGSWTRCSHDCGIGERKRERQCSATDLRNCIGEKMEKMLCMEKLCCEWTIWAGWTHCSHRCGGGRSSRTRLCVRPGYENIDDWTCSGQCYGGDREDMVCNEFPCAMHGTYEPTIVQTTSDSIHLRYNVPSLEQPIYPQASPSEQQSHVDPQSPESTLPTSTSVCSHATSSTDQAAHCQDQAKLRTIGMHPVRTGANEFSKSQLTSCTQGSSTVGSPCVLNKPAPIIDLTVPAPSMPSYISGTWSPAAPGCQWSAWQTWSSCSATCSPGTKRRFRRCITLMVNCNCIGDAMEMMDCVPLRACEV